MLTQPILIDSRLNSRGLGISKFAQALGGALRVLDVPTLQVGYVASKTANSRFELGAGMGPRNLMFSVSPRLWGAHSGQVVHFAANSGSVFAWRRSVLTVHDLFQSASVNATGRGQWLLLKRAMASCSVLVAVSTRTADAMVNFGIEKSKIIVIPHGMNSVLRTAHERTGVVAFTGNSARKRPELLCVIVEEWMKSNPGEAFTVISRAGVSEQNRQSLALSGASVVDDLNDEEVRSLLGRSRCLVVTSQEEGFGLPIVEAAEVGLPVVLACDAMVAEEAVGPHCVRTQTLAVSDWKHAIEDASRKCSVDFESYLPTWREVALRYRDLYYSLA